MKKRLLLASAVLPLLLAGTAEAQSSKWFYSLCHAGTLQTCASVRLSTLTVGTTTQVTVWLQNRQGAAYPWGLDNSGGSLITRFGIVTPQTGIAASGLAIGTLGGATAVNNPASMWSITTAPLAGTIQIGMKAGGSAPPNNSLDGAIQGCDTSVPNQTRKFITCGVNQYVAFTFSTSLIWDASQAEVAIFFDAVKNTYGTSGETECRTTLENCFTATPEPISMLLFGTGLAGVGMANVRRRRRLVS